MFFACAYCIFLNGYALKTISTTITHLVYWLFTYPQAPALPQRQQVLQKGEPDEAEFNLEALPPQESVTIN
jgi:hypothetical protein